MSSKPIKSRRLELEFFKKFTIETILKLKVSFLESNFSLEVRSAKFKLWRFISLACSWYQLITLAKRSVS